MVFSLSYYLVPETMFEIGSFEFNKNFVILALFLIIATAEFMRITGRWSFELFRVYEKRRISAPFWFTSTTALIILLFPQWFAVPVVLCVTFADPVIGELRRRNIRVYPLAGWIVCTLPFILFAYNPLIIIILATCATAAEVILNRVDEQAIFFATGIYDDNFMMQVFPALVLVIIWLMSNTFDLGLLPPGVEELLKPVF
jgi:hypothetical protein